MINGVLFLSKIGPLKTKTIKLFNKNKALELQFPRPHQPIQDQLLRYTVLI